MGITKSISSEELFVDGWKALDAVQAWRVVYHLDQIQLMRKKRQMACFGKSVRVILKQCIKSKYKSTLKSLEADALVDIFHDEGLFFHHGFKHFYKESIRVDGVRLLAPEEDIANVSFEHFKYLDAAFSQVLIDQYKQSDSINSLDKFCATLFYDPATGFDRNRVEPLIGKLPLLPFEKALLFRAYGFIRMNVMGRCPRLFGTSPSPSYQEENGAVGEGIPAYAGMTGKNRDDKGNTEPQYTGKMWHDLHFDLAETQAFSGYEAAGKASVYDVLDYLEKRASKSKRGK
ncbi:MAG: hypothetical protein AAF363_18650 [Bacteroidota bacterium]